MPNPTPTSPNQPNQFKALIAKNQDMVLVFLSAKFTEFLQHIDEALMDFAEQTQNPAMQGYFFEAMTGVRKFRPAIEQKFRAAIIEGFVNFSTKPTLSGKKNNESEELSLLDQEEMEEAVICENLVTRCRNNYFTQLYALVRRLNAMAPEQKITEEHTPAGPSHLIKSFKNSISELIIHTKAKIVLYALYDKFVLRQLHSMYDEFNDSLKNAGILPNLKQMVSKPKSAAETPKPATVDTTKDGSKDKTGKDQVSKSSKPSQKLGEELFDSILDLMSSQKGERPTGEGTVAKEDIVSAIDKIRPTKVGTGVLGDLEALPRLAVEPQFLDKVKHALTQEREQVLSQIDRSQIQAIDGDTIDLIGMLFEYMLKDPLLPNVAKALLSHLHTPYLKLALIDQQLLIDSEHPARILLDLLVEAGGRWVSEADIKRGVFPQIQTVVDRVLQEATDNPKLFSELLDFFRAAMEQQRRKSEGVEKRSQDTLKGKEKLFAAKRQAAQEIEAHIRQIKLPEPVEQFLNQAWTDRLAFILLRHIDGVKSQEWQQAIKMADNLVWLFDSERADISPQLVEEIRIGILKEIKNTLEAMGGYHQQHLESLFRFLNDPKAIIDWRAPVNDSDYIVEPLFDPEELIIKSADAMAKLHATTTAPITPTTSNATATVITAPVIMPVTKPAEEPTATKPITPGWSPTDNNLSESEQAMVEKLRHIKFGTWFEFKDGTNLRRLKLSWLSPVTLTCMFVDQAGIQAEVKTLADIARLLTSGKARVLPQPRQQFVQRTLVAIKGALQRAMESTD